MASASASDELGALSCAEETKLEVQIGHQEPLNLLLRELISERKQTKQAKRAYIAHSLKMQTYARVLKIGVLQTVLLAGGVALSMFIDYLGSATCPAMLRLQPSDPAPAASSALGYTLCILLSITLGLFLLGGLFTNLTLSRFAYQHAKLTLNPRMFTSFLVVFPFIIILFARLYLLLALELFTAAWLTNSLFAQYWEETLAKVTGQALIIGFAAIGLWCLPVANELKNSFMAWDTEALGRFRVVTQLIVVTFSLCFLAAYLGIVTVAGLDTGLYFRELMTKTKIGRR
ncbi:MAG: hypothetical protein ACFFGZ_10315 [Candidatus Thorarchaeota archaeon]